MHQEAKTRREIILPKEKQRKAEKRERKKKHEISQPTQQYTSYSLFAAALGACAYPKTPKR
jgi:hypothetical protein